MSNIAKWGDWGDDAVKEEAESLSAGRRKFMKLSEGDNIIRFLPPKIGKPSPFALTHNHFIKLPTGKSVSFNCPRMMNTKRACVACAKADQMRSSKSVVDQKAAKQLFPKVRVYANVIDRNNERAGVQVLAFNGGIMEELAKIRQNPRRGGNFTHPVTGRDIIITRTGTGAYDTRYSVSPDVETSALAGDSGLAELWIESAFDLDPFLFVLDDEEIKAKLRGEETDHRESRTISVTPKGRTIEDDADSFDPDSF